jgi:hypothetical protein
MTCSLLSVYPLLTLLSDIGWVILEARNDARLSYRIIGGERDAGASNIAAAIGTHAKYEE